MLRDAAAANVCRVHLAHCKRFVRTLPNCWTPTPLIDHSMFSFRNFCSSSSTVVLKSGKRAILPASWLLLMLPTLCVMFVTCNVYCQFCLGKCRQCGTEQQ